MDIEKENIPERKIEEYKKTEDVTLLKETRTRKSSAIHDVAAYLFVREKRGDNTRVFQKAKCWFITANKNLHDFNIKQKVNGFVNEIIMPSELASLLFLKNPQRLSKTVSGIALNELIAQTISEEYASKELINEFNTVIKSSVEISNEDYQILLESIATQSTKNIQNLINRASEENKQKFNEEIHKVIEKSRQQKYKEKEAREKAKEEKEAIVNEKLKTEDEKNELTKNLNRLNSLLELTRIKVEKEEESKQKIEDQNKILKAVIGFIILLVFSVAWWIVNNYFTIPYVNLLSKVLVQILLIGIYFLIFNKKYRPQSLTMCGALVIAIVTALCK